MINGVEILNKTEITKEVFPSWTGPVCFTIIIIALITGILLAFWLDEGFAILALGAVGVFLCLPMLAIAGNKAEEVPTGRYQYEATISDTTNFKEVYEQYDVVEQRGSIYVLEDKVVVSQGE